MERAVVETYKEFFTDYWMEWRIPYWSRSITDETHLSSKEWNIVRDMFVVASQVLSED